MRISNPGLFFIFFSLLTTINYPLPTVLYAADVPATMSYQGFVKNSGSVYNGTGYFKFAIVNSAGTTTYWSNDGTSSGGSEPTAAVSTTVSNGIFNIILGDTTITNMTALDKTIFANGVTLYLRVWFSTSGSSFELLSPDKQITSSAYAFNAYTAYQIEDDAITSSKISDSAVTSGKINDSAITSGKINDGAVTSAKIDSSAVTSGKIADDAVTSAKIEDGTITNANINASAEISASKISGTAATLTGNQNFDSGTLYIDASNNYVGVGNASPAAPLDIYRDYGSKTLSGDDVDYGLYASVKAGPITESGNNYQLYNLVASQIAGGTYSSVIGSYNYGYSTSTSSSNQDNLYGTLSAATLNASGGNVDTAHGCYALCTVTDGTIDSAIAFRGWNYGPASSITNGYGLYYDGSDDAITTSWGTYITGEDKNYFSGALGIGQSSPGGKLEVEVGSATGVTGILLDTDDADQIAMQITAGQIDADVMDITADAVTTAYIMDVTADALTLGSILNLVSNSSDTTSRYLVQVTNDNSGATSAIPLYLKQDSTSKIAYLYKAHNSTAAGTEYGLHLDYDDTGNVDSGTDTTYGNYIDVTRTGASGGTIDTYGLYSTVTGNVTAGTINTYGIYSAVTGNTSGTSKAYAGYFSASGASSNYGLVVASGNVGIGDTTPSYPLEIRTSGASGFLAVLANEHAEGYGLSVQTLANGTSDQVLAVKSGGDPDYRLMVFGDGKVRIGDSAIAPDYLLTMEASGGGYYDASDHQWHNGSTMAIKQDIRPNDFDIFEILNDVKIVNYRYKTEASKDSDVSYHIGFIAENTPELLSGKNRDSMATGDCIGLLLAAVKEQQSQIEKQNKVINEQQETIEALKKRLDAAGL